MRTCSQQEIAIPVPDDLSDKAVNNFFDRLAKCPETKSDAISLDCSKLEDVTSAHIGILFQAQDYINKKGMKTYLRYVTPSLMHLLKALDLMKLFIIEQSPARSEGDTGGNEETAILDLGYECNFHVVLEDIKEILEKFGEYLYKVGLSDPTAFELKTVFYEVAHNIYDHSGLKERDRITFIATIHKSKIVLEFSDNGIHFDPTSRISDLLLEDAVNSRKIRGFGLMMINKLVDSISYAYRDNRINVLRLEKAWRKGNE